jgi:hypothetical protein
MSRDAINLYGAFLTGGSGILADPGDGNTITFRQQFQICPIVTTGVETRIVAQPDRPGSIQALVLKTDGGNCTLTITGGYNAASATSIVLDDAGDRLVLHSVDIGGSYYWRIMSQEGTDALVANLNAIAIDAGASGTAGSVDIFPSTASKGKFALTCDDQDGDTTVTLKPAAMGQASTVSIPDPGAATANVVLTSAANDGTVVSATATELNQLDGTTLEAGSIITDVAVGGGAGMTGHIATLEHSVVKTGGLFKTEILLDLGGIESTATDGDIIGDSGGGPAYLCQITAARNGAIVAGRITCFVTPATGDDDIALYSATEATGAYDGAIADLTETLLLDHGPWTGNQTAGFTGNPAANEYLYLVAKGGDTSGTYSDGLFLIELWGK